MTLQIPYLIPYRLNKLWIHCSVSMILTGMALFWPASKAIGQDDKDSIYAMYTQQLCNVLWNPNEFKRDSAAYWIEKGARYNGTCNVDVSQLKLGKFLGSAAKKIITNNKYATVKKEYNHKIEVVTPFEATLRFSSDERFLYLLDFWNQSPQNKSSKDPFPFDAKYELIRKNREPLIDTLLKKGTRFEKADLSHVSDLTLIRKLVTAGADYKTLNIEHCAENMSCDELSTLFKEVYPIKEASVSYDAYLDTKPGTRHVDTTCLKLNGFELSQLNGKFFFSKNKPELLRKLIRNGVNPNTVVDERYKLRYTFGFLLLDQDSINPADIDFLVRYNFDLNQVVQIHRSELGNSNFACTPLIYAMLRKDDVTFQAILKHKPDINQDTERGKRAIFHAIDLNDLEKVKQLVELGANLNAKADNGRGGYVSPYSYAKGKYKITPEIIEYLKIQTKAYKKKSK